MKYNYTDIHCHILPGVDDGSQNMEQSLEMLTVAYEEGCRRIVMTPHYERECTQYEPEQLDQIFLQLKDKAEERFPDMELYLGNELLYEPGITDSVRDGFVHTMAGTRYVLVEFNIQIPYQELYQAMKELIQARFRPILAHVERYRCLTGNIDHMMELDELGIYFQMNAGSILGSIFDDNVRWCRKLMREEYISFLGTDAHNLDSRAPHMRQALEWMDKKLDSEYVKAITSEYPDLMLKNEYID